MTNACDLIPSHIRLLWEDTLDFIASLIEQFDYADLRAGIRRTSGVQLSIWINGAEAALRRLILIAALAFTPAAARPHRTHTPAPRIERQRSFTVFRLHDSRAPTRSSSHSYAPKPHTHIRFPADPILALGRIPTRRPNHRHNGGPILPRETQRHPLDRWVRLSRNDPDWRPPHPDGNPLGYYVIREKRKRIRKPPERLDSTADWRRCHDEWQKLVPAPNLAARLEALARAIANPHALIHRTARRLQSQRERTVALARTAYPAVHLPRRALRLETDDSSSANAISAHRAIDSS